MQHYKNNKETEPETYGFTWQGKKAAAAQAAGAAGYILCPCVEESVDWEHTQNVYIEGDNLPVLKLLRETYENKIKMIYIDPPYNTGSDTFVYADDFARHSDWCSMIYPRLLLAKDLLTEDGVIFL